LELLSFGNKPGIKEPHGTIDKMNSNGKRKNKNRARKRDGEPQPLSGVRLPATLASLGPIGFPKKLKMVHKYVEYLSFIPGTPYDVRQFSCNGLYDPNITGTGHQPLYFDQLSGVYNHYTVFKSTCTYRLVTTNVPVLVSHYIEDDTTVSTGSQSAEMSTATLTTHTNIAVKPTVLTRTWVGKDFFGGDLFDNDLLTGTAAANPSEQQYFTLSVQALDGVTNVTYQFLVEILYEAVWDELKTIAQS